MQRLFVLTGLAAALAIPIAATADPPATTGAPGSTVSTAGGSQLAPGTYTVKVVDVVDPKHIVVTLDNGSKATLSAGRPTVDFSKLQANDSVKVSINNGAVLVFLDMTTH